MDNGGSKVTEFYLYSADGKRIVGEVENIGPGLQGKLTVTAEEGDYLAACKPGMAGDGIRSAFTVTAPPKGSAAPSEDQVLISRAQNKYRTWVQRQSETLVVATRQFLAAYTTGNDDRARALYPTARSHYEAIEPVAESFGDLDPKMDAREPDVEPGTTWTGWHRIEKDLWPERDPKYHALSPAARAAMAADLMKNTQVLSQKIGTLTFTTDQIANGSSGLMEEVATSKVTGEEEYWSHTDLWDFAANVKGARAAFEDVQADPGEARPGARADSGRPVRRHRRVAGPASRRRRLRPLHRAQPGRGQAARRRGQRRLGAAVAPHRGGPALRW